MHTNPPRVLPRILIVAVILAVFHPVVSSVYGLADDFAFMQTARHIKAEMFEAGVCMGRPVSGLFWFAGFSLADTVGKLALLRAVGLLFGVAFVLVTYRAIKLNTETTSLTAASVALAVGLTPTFQLYAGWTTCYPFSLAALLGVCAGHLAAASPREISLATTIRRGITPVLLLVAACLIYQPVAMFFWFVPAIHLLRDRKLSRDAFVLFANCLVILFFAFAASFVIFRLGNLLYAVPNHSRGEINADLPGKLKWFLREPLRHFVIPWLLAPKASLVLPVMALTALGIWLGDRDSIKRAILRLTLAGALMVCAYLPNLLVRENWSSFRTVGAPAAIGILVIWTALEGYARCFPAVLKLGPPIALVTIAATSLGARYHLTAYVTAPQAAEWTFILKSLGNALKAPGQKLEKVSLIRPKYLVSLAPGVYYDEFGLPSSHPPWWEPVPIIEQALLANGCDLRTVKIDCIKEPVPNPPAGTFILDVNGFMSRKP